MFWNVSSATFDNFFSPFSTFFRHLFTCYLRTFSSFFRTLSGRMAECTVIQSVIFQTKTINLIAMLISRSIEWWIAVSEVERRLSGLFVEKQNNLLLPVIFRQYSATSPIPTTFSVKKNCPPTISFFGHFLQKWRKNLIHGHYGGQWYQYLNIHQLVLHTSHKHKVQPLEE